MAFQILGSVDRFSASPAARTRPVATFHQLQQLLEQSLRDLHDESSGPESADEQELSQALQRLTGRLHAILAESTDFNAPDARVALEPSFPVASSDSPPHIQVPIHLMTSCEGVILMANDAAVDLLDLDLANIGTMSLAEWISYEEWPLILQQLKAVHPPQEFMSWVVNLRISAVASDKMKCSGTPLLDKSRNVTAWHWEFRRCVESARTDPFSTLVQGLETELVNGQTLDDCLKRICDGFVETFGYPFVWIASVRDRQRIQLRAHAEASDLDWETQGPLWWSSISSQEVLAQACMASELSLVSRETSHTGEFSWFPAGFHLQEVCCVPLNIQEDFSGLLIVCSRMPQAFDVSVQGWLEALGHQIERVMARGVEMEQFRLHSAVVGSVDDAVCVTDPHGCVEWVNQAFTRLLGVTARQMTGTKLRSFPHSQLQEAWSSGDSPPQSIGCVKTEVIEKGSDGESLVLEQALTPLIDTQGQTTHFVVLLHDVTARAVAEMQIKHQAYHDALTDLPNRVMFEDHLRMGLAQARRDGNLLALLFLDLDNFKSINDRHGHQMGDRLLRVIAKRLVTCVRTTDTVSRLSGDEFTIILQGLDRIQDIRQVAQKILACLMAPIQLRGEDFPVQTSIGIAVSPNDSTDPCRLLAIADQAMYRAKDLGGQCWYFATPEWNMV